MFDYPGPAMRPWVSVRVWAVVRSPLDFNLMPSTSGSGWNDHAARFRLTRIQHITTAGLRLSNVDN